MSTFISFFRYEYFFRLLIILLPFTTVISVFTKEKLGIPGVSFYKELLLILMGLSVVLLHIKRWLRFQWTGFDLLIGFYIVYLVGISLMPGGTGISGVIYGGRYDFSFLVAFLIALHGARFLEQKAAYYCKLFLISWGLAICISLLVRFVFSEDALLFLGFSGNPSAWQFGWSVPIFHGVDGASIRRFQGILDGPNTMGAFLLLYIGVGLYYLRYKKEWYFVIGMAVFFFLGLIVLTYSRSALLGFIIATIATIVFSSRYLFVRYPRQVIALGLVFVLFLGAFFVKYGATAATIVSRSGSSKWHIERFLTGLERFKEHPFGQWLGAAGPGYRYVQDIKDLSREEMESLDRYYIPESWYVQQLVEWGVFWAGVFGVLILFLLVTLFRIHPILFGMFGSICVMNLFLHTFESSTISLLLFLILGIILGTQHYKDFLIYEPKK